MKFYHKLCRPWYKECWRKLLLACGTQKTMRSFFKKNPNQSSLHFVVEQTIGPGYGNHPTQKHSQHLMLTDLHCAAKDEPVFSEALVRNKEG